MPAEIPDGAVIVARAIVNSSLWTMRDQDLRLAIFCIVKANWKPGRFFDGERSTVVRRGQFITSLKKLAKESGLKLQQCRTSLKNLEKCDFLTRKSTHSWTLVTLPKYEHYQDLSRYSDSANTKANTPANTRLTRPQHAANMPLTTIEEGEEGKEREEGKEAPPPPSALSDAERDARSQETHDSNLLSMIKQLGPKGIPIVMAKVNSGELQCSPKVMKAIRKKAREHERNGK